MKPVLLDPDSAFPKRGILTRYGRKVVTHVIWKCPLVGIDHYFPLTEKTKLDANHIRLCVGGTLTINECQTPDENTNCHQCQ